MGGGVKINGIESTLVKSAKGNVVNIYDGRKGKAKVHVLRNHLEFPYNVRGTIQAENYSIESHGVTFTVQDDNSVLVNGTNDGTEFSTFIIGYSSDVSKYSGMYLCGMPKGVKGLFTSIELARTPWESYAIDTGDGCIISDDINSAYDINIFIRVELNKTVKNAVVRPMITSEFVPYDQYIKYGMTRLWTVAHNLCGMGRVRVSQPAEIYKSDIPIEKGTDIFICVYGGNGEYHINDFDIGVEYANGTGINYIGSFSENNNIFNIKCKTDVNCIRIKYSISSDEIPMCCMICPKDAPHKYMDQEKSMIAINPEDEWYYIDIFDGFNSFYTDQKTPIEVFYDNTETKMITSSEYHTHNIITKNTCEFRTTGWYRVAKTNRPSPHKFFSPCKIELFRQFNHCAPEFFDINFNCGYVTCDFHINTAHVDMMLMKQIRIMWYNQIGYIEVYYEYDMPNLVSVIIENLTDETLVPIWEICSNFEKVSDDYGTLVTKKYLTPTVDNEPYPIGSISGNSQTSIVEISGIYDYYMIICHMTDNTVYNSIAPYSDIANNGLQCISSGGTVCGQITYENNNYILSGATYTSSVKLYGIRGK